MSGFGGERGRAHTAIEAASDALAAAFVQHLAAKGPCAAVAAEGAAEWSVRAAAAQAAPSCPCSLPGAERLRGGGSGVGGRELVAAGSRRRGAADGRRRREPPLLAAQAPHAAPRGRRGWRSGRQRRARTAQASGATHPATRRCAPGSHQARHLPRPRTGSGRRGVALYRPPRHLARGVEADDPAGGGEFVERRCGTTHGASPAATLTR